jgi:hypothetical protein
MPLRISV